MKLFKSQNEKIALFTLCLVWVGLKVSSLFLKWIACEGIICEGVMIIFSFALSLVFIFQVIILMNVFGRLIYRKFKKNKDE